MISNKNIKFYSFIKAIILLLEMDSGHTVHDYTMLSVIGKGTYAKVFLVRCKKDNKVYAMKVLKKKHILEKNQ